MAERWGWTTIELGGSVPGIWHSGQVFDTKEEARASLQSSLDTRADGTTEAQAAALLRGAGWRGRELLVTCPPVHAFAVFPVSPGHSIEQAARFFVEDRQGELWQRLKETRSNWATSDSGCAVVAIALLGVTGVMASAWVSGIWGA